MTKPSVTMIGAGMIAHDQLLPSLFQLQRIGKIGDLTVCDMRAATVQKLADNEMIRRAFPDSTFRAVPDPSVDINAVDPEAFKKVLAEMPPRQIVVTAVPDNVHFRAIMSALEANQHVITVKPLVLTVAEAHKIEAEARRRELFVGIEYHKRFDDRSLLARRRYREGMFGEFKLGTARLMEKWYYRYSNFQNWFTCDSTDAFTYIGCHYVDLVHFITGLQPKSVSLYGIKDKFPNGNIGWLWTDARVIWENGAALNVQNTLSFPDEAPGSNTQGITMYFSNGEHGGAWLEHSDQYRGIKYCYTSKPDSPGATQFTEPSTEYFQYVDVGGTGLQAIGYGYRSVDALVSAAIRVENSSNRLATLDEIDHAAVLATPRNSAFNEAVIEAARLSIASEGREAMITPEGVSFDRPTRERVGRSYWQHGFVNELGQYVSAMGGRLRGPSGLAWASLLSEV